MCPALFGCVPASWLLLRKEWAVASQRRCGGLVGLHGNICAGRTGTLTPHPARGGPNWALLKARCARMCRRSAGRPHVRLGHAADRGRAHGGQRGTGPAPRRLAVRALAGPRRARMARGARGRRRGAARATRGRAAAWQRCACRLRQPSLQVRPRLRGYPFSFAGAPACMLPGSLCCSMVYIQAWLRSGLRRANTTHGSVLQCKCPVCTYM